MICRPICRVVSNSVSRLRALIGEPHLLLADEPTGNLDSAVGGAVLDLLFTLHRERGLTMVIATHDPAVLRVVNVSSGFATGDRGCVGSAMTSCGSRFRR